MKKIILLSALSISTVGCVSTEHSKRNASEYPLAMAKPIEAREKITTFHLASNQLPVFQYQVSSKEYDDINTSENMLNSLGLQNIEPAAGDEDHKVSEFYKDLHHGYVGRDYSAYEIADGEARLPDSRLNANSSPSSCSTKDRFDRKDLVAYKWGSTGENRLGFDVDGIGLRSANLDQVKLTYSLRLQPEKKKHERCLYQSSWQGMVGSGYNELFVRENDTVIDRAKKWTDRIQY